MRNPPSRKAAAFGHGRGKVRRVCIRSPDWDIRSGAVDGGGNILPRQQDAPCHKGRERGKGFGNEEAFGNIGRGAAVRMLLGARGLRRLVFLERGEFVRIGERVGGERIRLERIERLDVGKRGFRFGGLGERVGLFGVE